MSKTAVITGATSGIGAEYARRLAAVGCNLIITGRREEIIQKLANELEQEHKVKANVIIAELSDDNDIQKVLDAIQATDNIEFLINNAGYCMPGQCYGDSDSGDCEANLKVLTVVPVRLVNAVLPGMREKRKGTIINVSSIAALFPGKYMATYCASKAFLKSFSESLYQELRREGIKVQVLCPGYIDTDFYRNLPREKKIFEDFHMKKMTADQVVDCSLKYLKANRSICLPGMSYKALNVLYTLLPRPALYAFSERMFSSLQS